MLFLHAYQELRSNDVLSPASIQILLYSLISNDALTGRHRFPNWIDNLRELLNDRWNDQLSLTELSQALNVHPVTISKHFTKYFGCTYGEYIRRLRINKSIVLIKRTGFSLTEIALHCGFFDQSHFTKTFKELTGFLPKDFKNL